MVVDQENEENGDKVPRGGVEETKEGREKERGKEMKVGGLALCMAYNKARTWLKDPKGRRLRDSFRLQAFESIYKLQVASYMELFWGWLAGQCNVASVVQPDL